MSLRQLSLKEGKHWSFTKSRSSRRKRSAKKKSKSTRKRSQKSSKRRRTGARLSCIVDPALVGLLNTIKWDVTQPIDQATVMGRPITVEESNSIVCTRNLKILLPAAFASPQDQLAVIYELPLKKAYVKVGDILWTIYKFYNFTSVTEADKRNLATMPSHLAKLAQPSLKFREFIQGYSQYVGLIEQEQGMYLVQLGPSGTVPTSSLLA